MAGVCVLLFGAAIGLISHKASLDAQAYVADHPPATTTTTVQTWLGLPAGANCDAYPYSEMEACDKETTP